MIINATSHTMKNIWKFFLVIFLLVTFVFIFLQNGIRIDSLTLPNIKIKQLYIKLDKKFIVTAHSIDINLNSKRKTSLSEIQFLTNKAPIFNGLFKTISVLHLNLNNKSIRFLFKDDIFYIDSDLLTVDARVTPFKNTIEVDINQIYLKDYRVKLNGLLTINTSNKVVNFRGNYNTYNIEGAAELKIDKNILYYRLNSTKFTTLAPFMDFLTKKIDLEPLLSAWIYKKIVAKEYILNNLEGKINIKTLDYYPNLIKAKASVKDIVVNFHPNIPSATIDDLKITLKDDNLLFGIKKAQYEGKDLSQSNVHIYNLLEKGSGIVIDLNANTMLDESIQKILKAYKIDIPITQTAGKTQTNVILDIRFLPLEVKNYSGSFKINDANMTLAGLPIYSKDGRIQLDNGKVYIEKANLKYNKLFDVYTSGTLDTATKIYKSKNYIKSLHVNLGKTQLLNIHDLNSSATLNFNKKTIIDINKLNTTLNFDDTMNSIEVTNLSPLYDYSKLMQDTQVKDGKLLIKTKDFQHFNVLANLTNIKLPIRQDGNEINNLDLIIKVDNTHFTAQSLDKNIKISQEKQLKIKIKNLDVTFDSSKLDKSLGIKNVKVEGINSNIIDTNSSMIIPSTHYIYTLNDTNMSLENQYLSQKMLIQQSDLLLHVKSENLKAPYINALFGQDIFKDGLFNFHINGTNTKNFKGTLVAANTTLLGMNFYNNIMALIDTIPALLTFKIPGFNDKGYSINKATVHFSKKNNILTINYLEIDGKSTDIIGNGTLNSKTNDINMTLQLSVLKSLSSVINKIPVLNYIILGEDGKLYTTLNVTGTLDRPQIKTNVISNTIMSPLNIIKRVIQAPFSGKVKSVIK